MSQTLFALAVMVKQCFCAPLHPQIPQKGIHQSDPDLLDWRSSELTPLESHEV